MTESEWLDCTDPTTMLQFLRGKTSDRKMRLFAVACCRRIWHLLLDERCRKGIEVAEQYADGVATKGELDAADNEVRATIASEGHAALAVYHAFFAPHHDSRYVCNHAIGAADQAVFAIAGNAMQDQGANLQAIADPFASNQCTALDSERAAQVKAVHDIFGNTFHPLNHVSFKLAGPVIALGQAIYSERSFDRLPILADAMEEAGCNNEEILNHCRSGGEHSRGCWVIDLVMGKA